MNDNEQNANLNEINQEIQPKDCEGSREVTIFILYINCV